MNFKFIESTDCLNMLSFSSSGPIDASSVFFCMASELVHGYGNSACIEQRGRILDSTKSLRDHARTLVVAGEKEHPLIKSSLPIFAMSLKNCLTAVIPGLGHGWAGQDPTTVAAEISVTKLQFRMEQGRSRKAFQT